MATSLPHEPYAAFLSIACTATLPWRDLPSRPCPKARFWGASAWPSELDLLVQLRKLPATVCLGDTKDDRAATHGCPVVQEAALGASGAEQSDQGQGQGEGPRHMVAAGLRTPLTWRLWAQRRGPWAASRCRSWGSAQFFSSVPGPPGGSTVPDRGATRRLDGLACGALWSVSGAPGRWSLCQQVPAQTCCEGSPAVCVALTWPLWFPKNV